MTATGYQDEQTERLVVSLRAAAASAPEYDPARPGEWTSLPNGCGHYGRLPCGCVLFTMQWAPSSPVRIMLRAGPESCQIEHVQADWGMKETAS